jgi:hypothetical protein
MTAVRTTSRLVAALFGACLVVGLTAPTASAQDPYGATTTTAPPARTIEASCRVTPDEGRVNDAVTATVSGVFLGENVRLLFDGVQVGATTAPTTGGTTGSGGVPTATVTFDFRVPAAAPGVHIVTAVGDTFSAFCGPNGEFRVLAAKSPRSLARTGIYTVLYLVLAAILLGIGSELVLRARRRRARILGATEEDDEPYVYTRR